MSAHNLIFVLLLLVYNHKTNGETVLPPNIIEVTDVTMLAIHAAARSGQEQGSTETVPTASNSTVNRSGNCKKSWSSAVLAGQNN